MKLDNKLQPSSSTEHNAKVAECNGNHEPQRLTVNDDVGSKGKCSFITLAECLSREKDFESHQVAGGASINHGTCVDDVCAATSYVPLPEFEMGRDKNDLHGEKAAMEIEQSKKTIVCFERGDRHVVKDIGIDEGTDSSDSVPQKNDDEEEFLTVFSRDDECAPSNGLHDPNNGLKSSFPNRNPFSVDAKENLPHVSGFNTHNENSVHVSKEESTTAVPSNQEHVRNSHELSSFDDIIGDQQGAKYVVTGNILSGKHDGSNQDSLEQGSSTTAAKHVDGPTDSSGDEQNPGPVLGRDAEMHSSTTVDEEIKTVGHQQGDRSMFGTTLGENPTTSRNPFLLHDHAGDTTPYGPHVLSERIHCSGHSAYSGSVSIRSDSSTTSTCSFAFPILQSEWNSSPVKMAKADRRHYRKYHGWRSRLFCCRF